MLKRCAAAALLALTGCVTEVDDPSDGLPLRDPAVAVDSPALDTLGDRVPVEPPTWTNHRPQPGTDFIATAEDNEVKVKIDAILANDVDPDGGRVVFAGLGAHAGGTALVVDQWVVFTPAPDFTGLAFFDYVISDGRLQAAGRVKVTVTAVNDPPIAFAEQINTRTDQPITFRLEGMDPDGDPLMIDIVEQPAHGGLQGSADKYLYSPESAWTGTDRLVYRVGDGSAWSEPETVDLVVDPMN